MRHRALPGRVIVQVAGASDLQSIFAVLVIAQRIFCILTARSAQLQSSHQLAEFRGIRHTCISNGIRCKLVFRSIRQFRKSVQCHFDLRRMCFRICIVQSPQHIVCLDKILRFIIGNRDLVLCFSCNIFIPTIKILGAKRKAGSSVNMVDNIFFRRIIIVADHTVAERKIRIQELNALQIFHVAERQMSNLGNLFFNNDFRDGILYLVPRECTV